MVRPIDAVQVLNDINWHHKPTPVSEFESGFNRGLNQAMWIITHAPTLTPPNEPPMLDKKRVIEDILGDEYDLDRLRELAEADGEGRCVVLPCKRGDVLWTFHTYPSERVYSFHVTDLSTLNGRTMLNTDIMGVVDARDVGKTVFLTRAEAEKALKARGQE